MKEFFKVLGRYVMPYKGYLAGSLLFNLLSAMLNVFSFMSIIPMLQMLFGMNSKVYHFIPWDTAGMSFKDIAVNNGYYLTDQLIAIYGASTTLLLIGLFLVVTTLLKTGSYFASAAIMVPMRTGIVRDIRIQVYHKILSLPLSFFSDERKGDIIARMSGDVNEIENSVTGSLEMLIKNPILLICYFAVLIYTSWQLTLFTIIVLPAMGWAMGRIGRKLKSKSLYAQNKWSETMAQLEETLGGMRIIKAFTAERKMADRFDSCTNNYRHAATRVAIRQASAHPVSEFLGTVLIVLVLWYGGTLIFSKHSPIDAPTFIFYMVILYSIIQPLKDFARATYNIPKGMASVERVNKILNAPNPIREDPNPLPFSGLKNEICFNDVHFSYGTGAEVIHGVSLRIKRGETIAIVGQSGSGKSTLVDLLPRYHDVTGGSITIDGVDIRHLRIADLRGIIGNVNQDAILFNDTFYNNITFGVQHATMEEVIAAAKVANAHEFIMESEKGYETTVGDRGCRLSGGQRQRISIGIAMIMNPDFIVADEPVSALDVSVQAQILNLMKELQEKHGLTWMFISHDLNVVHYISDRIGVMYLGKIVEIGNVEEVYQDPKHPYTKALLSSIPDLDAGPKEHEIIEGDVPSAVDPGPGCAFASRCKYATERCRKETPVLKDIGGRKVSCFLCGSE